MTMMPLPLDKAQQKWVYRRDLLRPASLKEVFTRIHDHLAANASSITRSEALARQLITLLFVKAHDELSTFPDAPLSFCWRPGETALQLKQRLTRFFQEEVKSAYRGIFDDEDKLDLDAESLSFAVLALQGFLVTESERDAVGEAFESIIGSTLKGSRGQFFTPRNVVRMIVEMVSPSPDERILDPACGSGGFLTTAMRYMSERYHLSDLDTAQLHLFGVDKDKFLAKVAQAYLTIIGSGGRVLHEDSLASPERWQEDARQILRFGSFDVVMTNPPFGTKLTIKDEERLSQYDLGRKWRRDRSTGQWRKTPKVAPTSLQILFIERALDFLKDGGRLGIVLPESLMANPSYGYVTEYMRRRGRIEAVVAMPEELFQPFTHTKSCVVVLTKGGKSRGTIFMATAKWCGHDSRGKPLYRSQDGHKELLDDIPEITKRFVSLARQKDTSLRHTHLGFLIKNEDIQDNIFVPKYYDPEIRQALIALEQTHDLVTIGDLVEQKVLSITTGVEVGRLAYGTGNIPFIRTSDIVNWELKIDPKHAVSEEIYEEYRARAHVQPYDILMVRDGTYLVGTSCMITEVDTRILFQSHIYRIRVLKPDLIDPFLLFALLNTPIVKRQIYAKRFTQHIIDTLGGRVKEIVLPIPRDPMLRERISTRTREIIETRARLRTAAHEVVAEAIKGLALEEDLD